MGVWNVTAGLVFGRLTSSSWRAERAYYLMSCPISAVYKAVSGGALRVRWEGGLRLRVQ